MDPKTTYKPQEPLSAETRADLQRLARRWAIWSALQRAQGRVLARLAAELAALCICAAIGGGNG